jgi:hypothetical protein
VPAVAGLLEAVSPHVIETVDGMPGFPATFYLRSALI